MNRQTRRKLRGIAEPVLPGEPLFIRACRAFVDNYVTLLRTAMLVGALLLVSDIDNMTSRLDPPAPGQLQVLESAESAPRPPPDDAVAEPALLTDGIRHALSCTYEEFRKEHYDECFDGGSEVYARPDAGPDNRGGLLELPPERYASLDRRASPAGDPAT